MSVLVKPRASATYIGPGQQQPQPPVSWNNASLPSEIDAKGHGPEADDHDPQQTGSQTPPPPPPNSIAARLSSLSSSKLRQRLRCSKRRLLQQILVKLNHAESSDDADYLVLRDRQLDLLERIAALTTHVKSFATNLVALGHISSLIGDANVQIAVTSRAQGFAMTGAGRIGGGGGGSPGSNQGEFARRPSSGFGAASFDSDFPKNMVKLESNARELAGVVLSTIVGSLEKKLEAMVTLKREMDERENFKLDFDSALRKFGLAKQRGKADAIVRRDVKLQVARNTLALATDAVVKKFQYYESARPVLVYHELRQFRELQAQFFSLCASSFQMREQRGLCDDDDDDVDTDGSRHLRQRRASLALSGQ